MRAPIVLKTLSVVLFLFALGHTLGTSTPQVERGAPEAALFNAMQSVRFPIMGFTRSYWDFYRGLAITVGILMFALSAIAWQLAAVARRSPREALPIAVSLLVACAGMLIVGFEFLFTIPILFSAVTVLLAATVVVMLFGGRSDQKLIAEKAGRSGTHDTGQHIEEIIRDEARRSR